MTTLAVTLFAAFVIASALQLFFACVFARRLRDYRVPEVAEDRLPKVAVILCLRGVDPFLDECLERLTRLDYPRYIVRVVVDSPEDAARDCVERWAARHCELPISIDFLRDPSPSCSLYCSAIHQAVRGLDESIEAIVFANADTMPHPGWLRSLAAPLTDERVGAVTGNRWYVPAVGKMGSLVRYVQNASMVLVMYFLNLTWGGSLSVKRTVFDNSEFLAELRNSPCEDQAIRHGLERAGLKVACSPAVLMVNTEECHVRSAYHFLRRQILWTRLYHPGWPSVLGQALGAAALIAAAILVFWTSVALGRWSDAGWVLSGSAVCLLANMLFLGFLQRAVGQRVEQDQGQPMARFRRSVLPKFLPAAPLALFVYLAATFSAAVAHCVDWRGVSYQVVPPRGLRLLKYRKYLQSHAAAAERLSL
ncbi:MAG: glycosyltransferase [Thermoguttaceae bacterium]